VFLVEKGLFVIPFQRVPPRRLTYPLPLRRPRAGRTRSLCAVVDHEFDRFAVRIGLGTGITREADHRVLRFSVGTHF